MVLPLLLLVSVVPARASPPRGALVSSPKAAPSCAVVTQADTYGAHVDTKRLTSTGFEDRDNECCQFCADNPACEHWVRDTTTNLCWLKKSWTGNTASTTRRMGFRGQNVLACKVVNFVYGLVSKVVRLIPISLGSAIQNLRIELPNNLKCVLADQGTGKHVSMIGNLTIMADTKFDLRKTNIPIADTLYGSAQVFLQADPYIELDVEKCSVDVLQLGVWNLGVGINNVADKWDWLTNWVGGNRHSGFGNVYCKEMLPAHPSSDMWGTRVTEIQVSGDTQEDADAACCAACQQNSECEVFTLEVKESGPWTCWLRRLSIPNTLYHSSYKGHLEVMQGYDMPGTWVGWYHDVAGDTQDEKDANCAALCNEIEKCEVWVQSIATTDCWLKQVSTSNGLLNRGVFGISGKSIANWLGSLALKSILNKVLRYVCKNSPVDVSKLLDIQADLSGSGSIALDVAEDFWATADFTNADDWARKTFQASTADFSVSTSWFHPELKALLEHLLSDMKSSLAQEMVTQIGTPIGFFIGGLISKCAADQGTCTSNGADLQANPAASSERLPYILA